MQKFEIKGKGPALKGFITKIIDENQFNMAFQGSYYYSKEKNDHFENFINRLLSESIFPIIIHHISRKHLKEKLKIQNIRVNMFSDFRKNVIIVNDDELSYTIKTDEEHNLQVGDIVKDNQKGGITKIEAKNRDPNAGIIALAKYRDRWYGFFDCTYNRQHVIEKHKRAKQFLRSGQLNFENKIYHAFYQSIWDAFELYIEIMSLMIGDISVGASHDKIVKEFENFCESNALPYLRYFRTLTEIREDSRYGPPHIPIERIDMEVIAFFKVVKQLDKYVEDFLERRQVIFKNETNYAIENIDFESSKYEEDYHKY